MAVHLPIGVVLLYPWFELAGLLARQRSLHFGAMGLLGVGLLSSMFASATGEAAYDAAAAAGHSHELLETHEVWSGKVVWALLAVLGVRFFVARERPRLAAWLGFGLGLGLIALVVMVGWTGGRLTYEHGVGVRP